MKRRTAAPRRRDGPAAWGGGGAAAQARRRARARGDSGALSPHRNAKCPIWPESPSI